MILSDANYLNSSGELNPGVFDEGGFFWPTREKAVEFYSGWLGRNEVAKRIKAIESIRLEMQSAYHAEMNNISRLLSLYGLRCYSSQGYGEDARIEMMQAYTLVPDPVSTECVNTSCKYFDAMEIRDNTCCGTLEFSEMSQLKAQVRKELLESEEYTQEGW